MIKEGFCKLCGKEFVGERSTRLYCSKKCVDTVYNRTTRKVWSKRLRTNIRKELTALKLQKGCSLCGYNKCARALCFHHLGNKKVKMASTDAYRKEIVFQEIKKCVVLCHNCHMELHDGIIELDT